MELPNVLIVLLAIIFTGNYKLIKALFNFSLLAVRIIHGKKVETTKFREFVW